MPSSTVKSLAGKAGVSIDKVEGYWNKAKAIVKEKGESGGLKFPKDEDKWGDKQWAYITGMVKNMLGIKDSRVRDSALSPDVNKMAEKLRSDKLYSQYYYRFGRYMRKSINNLEIKHTTEALRFFNDLKVKIDKLSGKGDISGDANKLKKYIDDVIEVCIKDDGVISSEEFEVFFNILYGIYQGMLNYVGKNLNDSERFFYEYFSRVTDGKVTFRKNILDREEPTVTLKGMMALGTRYAICLEQLKRMKDATTSANIASTPGSLGKPKKKKKKKKEDMEQIPLEDIEVLQKEAGNQLLKLLDTIKEFLASGDPSGIDRLIF